MELTELAGIGPVRAETLRAMGIFSLRDLLYTLPVKYEDHSTVTPCSTSQEGMILVSGTMLREPKLSVFANVLLLGQKRGELICNDPDITAELILHSVNSLWIKICTIIISAEENQTDTDLSYLLRITECYRRSIERMLSVTYGSIKLIDIPEIGKLSDQIHNHWKK